MTPVTAEPLRIGCVRYLNARPLIEGWPTEVILDHPAALCRQLANGALDVALVSSFEYLRNPIYTIADGLSISSDGPAYSVFVAHRGELSKIEEVELDPASETSVNLLRCLFAELGISARLYPNILPNESSIAPGRARLLIGDQAIRFRQLHQSHYSYWDLGEQWKRLFGLPFVYALWLIRPDVAAPEIISARLRTLRDANLAELDELIGRQAEFSPEFCARYFGDFLKYDFAQPEKEGLLRFRSLCEKHGLLLESKTRLRLA